MNLSQCVLLASLSGGVALLVAFLFVERASSAPMLPLTLFQSRTFSAVNLLTLLLYAALGGVWFFLPFALIQVHGYSATVAGTTFLPFTILIAALSRWAGGLLDRYGARLPLIVGSAIAAFGIALMGVIVPDGAYWQFLVAITILGFGMVITVVPLTTAVIDAVPAHQTGVASGINNAVASVANLLAIAILGAVAILILDHALDGRLQSGILSEGVKHAIAAAHGQLVIEPSLANLQGDDRTTAALILKRSLGDPFNPSNTSSAVQSNWSACMGPAVLGRGSPGALTSGLLFKPETNQMNEKLPAPCEACRGSGLRHGSVCDECQGKGYQLIVNGNQMVPLRQDKPQRWQGQRPAHHRR
jgi:hypothetical protein